MGFADITSTLPWPIQQKVDTTIEKTDGSETTLTAEIIALLSAARNTFIHPAGCATGATGCGVSLTGTPIAYAWGCNYNEDGEPFAESDAGTFVSSYYPTYSANTTQRLGSLCSDYCNDVNEPWTYTFFDNVVGTDSYTGFALSIGVNPHDVIDISTSADTAFYSGTSDYSYTLFSGDTYCNYNDLIVATFRSRGVSTLTSGGPVYQVTGSTDVSMVCTGSTFDDVTTNPFGVFGIDVVDVDGDAFRFETSMAQTQRNFTLKECLGFNLLIKIWKKSLSL